MAVCAEDVSGDCDLQEVGAYQCGALAKPNAVMNDPAYGAPRRVRRLAGPSDDCDGWTAAVR